jgi:hypothetical protein
VGVLGEVIGGERLNHEAHERARRARKAFVCFALFRSVRVPDRPRRTTLYHIFAYLDDLQAQVDELTALQDATQAESDALLPSVLDRAFRGEL